MDAPEAREILSRATGLLTQPTLENMFRVEPLLISAAEAVREGRLGGQPNDLAQAVRQCARLLHNAAALRMGSATLLYDGSGASSLVAGASRLRVEA